MFRDEIEDDGREGVVVVVEKDVREREGLVEGGGVEGIGE